MTTAGEPYQIRMTPDRQTIMADGIDLSYILIEALDKHGNICPLANNIIDLKLTGSGTIAGVGNGNPQSLEPFQANSIRLFFGKAMLIVRSGMSKGTCMVTATSIGMLPDIKNLKTD